MASVRKFLQYALDKCNERVAVAPFVGHLREMARQNDKRSAYVQIWVEDEVVKELKGDPKKASHYYYLIRVEKSVEDTMDSGLILAPGDV